MWVVLSCPRQANQAAHDLTHWVVSCNLFGLIPISQIPDYILNVDQEIGVESPVLVPFSF